MASARKCSNVCCSEHRGHVGTTRQVKVNEKHWSPAAWIHLSKPHLQSLRLSSSVNYCVYSWRLPGVNVCNSINMKQKVTAKKTSIIHPWVPFMVCLLDVFLQINRKHKPTEMQMFGWKACSGRMVGGGSLPYPPLARAFYRALNRASTHVFFKRLALTFRLIITHNQHLCSHYFSTFFFFLNSDMSFFLIFYICVCARLMEGPIKCQMEIITLSHIFLYV